MGINAIDEQPYVKGNSHWHSVLMVQELDFWMSHPESCTPEDFFEICKRRGFDAQEQATMLTVLRECKVVQWA